MADKVTVSTLDTNQIATTDLSGPQTTPSPNLTERQNPTENQSPTEVQNPSEGQNPAAAPLSDPLYSPQGPDPEGTNPAAVEAMAKDTESKGANAPGVEGEQVIWEARYSMKNFIGRLVARAVLTLGWIGLALYTWVDGHPSMSFLTIVLGIVLGVIWLAIGYRILKARYGHYYRLTNRRLFVSTGLMRRRRDQMELLRVKDVFTRQTLMERWLSLGTVVVVSTEQSLPTFYLAGVNDPKRVMDLVWHCARSERDGKTVQVENM